MALWMKKKVVKEIKMNRSVEFENMSKYAFFIKYAVCDVGHKVDWNNLIKYETFQSNKMLAAIQKVCWSWLY